MTPRTPTKAKPCLAALCCLCIGGLFAANPAFAQQPDKAQLRAACMEDYKTHCAGVMPGGGAVAECLAANLDKLTPECRAGFEAWKKNRQKG